MPDWGSGAHLRIWRSASTTRASTWQRSITDVAALADARACCEKGRPDTSWSRPGVSWKTWRGTGHTAEGLRMRTMTEDRGPRYSRYSRTNTFKGFKGTEGYSRTEDRGIQDFRNLGI